ncbi:MAG: hypothetical protein IT430_09575 [Phycisphaerales bacterium]|nr:hypothetical protein [Phycisphaerales bacterium]
MTSTGTDSARGGPTAWAGAAATASIGVLLLLVAGGCNTTLADYSRRPPVTGLAAESNPGATPGAAPGEPVSRVIQIEPEPQRDAQLDALVKESLDHLRSGEIPEALEVLTQAQTVEGWMHSEHAPAVLFWTGHCYDQLGERNAAMASFRRITIQYPRSAFAERAVRRLRELRSRQGQNRP